ncbi:LOW QUALITY PROTEIN: hypothetical protein PHMEG_00037850 [Phytophthora megakarya]|uniref:MULE transposase domain-containing protein n=1 Tax=Phytophthora megakarya TaxID=4795 RepID=A0A225UIP5_9STRA|nr:LOW QUALITY PROTEIN: hypothetical protein PHMEG_00037850 [Phytophthora megakarya]
MATTDVGVRHCVHGIVIRKVRADVLAIQIVALPARSTWGELRDEFYGSEKPDVLRGLSEQQVVSRVHRARNLDFNGDMRGAVEIPPVSLLLNEAVPFFSVSLRYDQARQLEYAYAIVGLSAPFAVLFVDGTFRCVPRGYKQCVIVMVHDRATGMSVPVYYVLSTSREERAYWNIVHVIAQGTDQQIEPAEIVCDFEPALQNALQVQFPNAIVIGCLFPLNQALRRAMKMFAIPDVECTIARMYNYHDSWCFRRAVVIAHDHVELGIKWVKQEICRRCSATFIYYSKMVGFLGVLLTYLIGAIGCGSLKRSRFRQRGGCSHE